MDDKWIIEIPRGQRPGQDQLPPHYYGETNGLGGFTSRPHALEFDTEAAAQAVVAKLRWGNAHIKRIWEP